MRAGGTKNFGIIADTKGSVGYRIETFLSNITSIFKSMCLPSPLSRCALCRLARIV